MNEREDKNMTALNIFYGIMAFMAFILSICIICLVSSCDEFIRNKSKSITSKRESDVIENRVANTAAVLDMMSYLIHGEIIKKISLLSLMNASYNFLNIDNDVKEVSEKVFNALKKDIFVSEEILITEDYLMEHISKNTMIELSAALKEANMRIYYENNTV